MIGRLVSADRQHLYVHRQQQFRRSCANEPERIVVKSDSGGYGRIRQELGRIGGGGRNRPDIPAVAGAKCLNSLGIQRNSSLLCDTRFNSFGVRFGVRPCLRMVTPTFGEAWTRRKRNVLAR